MYVRSMVKAGKKGAKVDLAPKFSRQNLVHFFQNRQVKIKSTGTIQYDTYLRSYRTDHLDHTELIPVW